MPMTSLPNIVSVSIFLGTVIPAGAAAAAGLLPPPDLWSLPPPDEHAVAVTASRARPRTEAARLLGMAKEGMSGSQLEDEGCPWERCPAAALRQVSEPGDGVAAARPASVCPEG